MIPSPDSPARSGSLTASAAITEPDQCTPQLLKIPLARKRIRSTVERQPNLSTDDIVPAEARLAVPISANVAESLIRHVQYNIPVTADSIAWDIRRQLGHEAGLNFYVRARWILDD